MPSDLSQPRGGGGLVRFFSRVGFANLLLWGGTYIVSGFHAMDIVGHAASEGQFLRLICHRACAFS